MLALCERVSSSDLAAKFAYFNLSSNIVPKKLLNLGVVMYLLWLGILFSISIAFVSRAVVVTKLLTSGSLLSTAPIFLLKAVLPTKLLTSGVFLSFSNFCIKSSISN